MKLNFVIEIPCKTHKSGPIPSPNPRIEPPAILPPTQEVLPTQAPVPTPIPVPTLVPIPDPDPAPIPDLTLTPAPVPIPDLTLTQAAAPIKAPILTPIPIPAPTPKEQLLSQREFTPVRKEMLHSEKMRKKEEIITATATNSELKRQLHYIEEDQALVKEKAETRIQTIQERIAKKKLELESLKVIPENPEQDLNENLMKMKFELAQKNKNFHEMTLFIGEYLKEKKELLTSLESERRQIKELELKVIALKGSL